MKVQPTQAHKGSAGWTAVWLPTKKGQLFPGVKGIHTGEAPAGGGVKTRLADVLHTGPVPETYHLSPTAGLGIAVRADRRGKSIPDLLKAAVAERVASGARPLKATVEAEAEGEDGKREERLAGLAECLRSYLDPTLHMSVQQGGSVGWNGDPTPKMMDGLSPCLRAQQGGEGIGVAAFAETGFARFDHADAAGTLRAKGGTMGGGSETVVTTQVAMESINYAEIDVAPTLDARAKDGPVRNQVATMVAAFAQNTRDEVRAVGGDGQRASCLTAAPGAKGFDYIVDGRRPLPIRQRRVAAAGAFTPSYYSRGPGMALSEIVGTLTAQAKQGDTTVHVAGMFGDEEEPAVGAFSYKMGADAGGIGWDGDTAPTLKAGNHDAAVAAPCGGFTSKDYGNDFAMDLCPTIRCGSGGGPTNPAVAIDTGLHASGGFVPRGRTEAMGLDELIDLAEAAFALRGVRFVLRRLTPVECLRLQGFPDDHMDVEFCKRRKDGTRTPNVKDPARVAELKAWHASEGRHYTDEEIMFLVSDGVKYKAAGNSMAVPCMRRLARGIWQQVRARNPNLQPRAEAAA